ncbi:hypothetical protein KUL10_14730 [Glaciecola sp. KUL10]|nr:hypothetical protein KUL10_14730 [Glaciecola sp. KUL10]
MPGIKLITGIPRSGTTLCCNIINQQANTIALHEPIDPSSVTVKENVIETLDKKLKLLKQPFFEVKPLNTVM